MGGECSTVLARPIPVLDGCQTLGACQSGECSRRPCNVDVCCEDDLPPPPIFGTPHPLLDRQLEGLDDETPRTPRGPVPPWIVSAQTPDVDKTSTGVTPPRTLAPSRSTPPGLPEEKSVIRAPSLASALGESFVLELFKAVRGNDGAKLNLLLQRAYGTSITLMGGGAVGSTSLATSTDRSEKVDEAVALFLSRARDPSMPGVAINETLLNAAASEGNLEAIQLLLEARADPYVADSQGCLPLHRAAEGAHLMPVLMLLDRMHASSRSINVATLTNAEGETPEMLAALSGATSVCRAFEVFSDMQDDAGLRQLGDIANLPVLDLAANPKSAEGVSSTAFLREAVGSSLSINRFKRVLINEAHMQQMIRQASNGIRDAEHHLLTSIWEVPASPNGKSSAIQRFMATAELRCSWQNLRTEAVNECGRGGSLRDFWQTHLSAHTLTGTLEQDRTANGGDVLFHTLLSVLWLYTREAWLHHIVDALACVIHEADFPKVASTVDGTTGATPLDGIPNLSGVLNSAAPLVQALHPFMQLIQMALLYFDEKGVRHTGTTYRPMFLPTSELRRLVDRYNEARDGNKDDTLASGAWITLGAGNFCSMSSRQEAAKRLADTRCNVLLAIRPDESSPCYPKHLVLKGSSVDDVLFPLGVVFKVQRITRTVSSDVDPECNRSSSARWPVVVIELAAADRFLEALEILDARGDLVLGEMEARLQEWIDGAALDAQYARYRAAGELLAKSNTLSAGGERVEKAVQWIERAVGIAEENGDAEAAAQALLIRARTLAPKNPSMLQDDYKHAMRLLADAKGDGHADVRAARARWAELGVRQV